MRSIVQMYPVIDADDLQREVNRYFGCDIDEIRNLLFDDDYNNDSYKNFFFDELEVPEEEEGEEKVTLRNLVRRYLKVHVPNYCSVIIDVSW